MGLNAAGGNVGVSSVQLIVPGVVGLAAFGSPPGLHLENIALVWVPLSLVAPAGAYFFMDNLTEAKSSFREQVAVARQRQTWVMALLYVGTFCQVPGLMETIKPRRYEHAGTMEVPRRVAGTRDPVDVGRPEGPSQPAGCLCSAR